MKRASEYESRPIEWVWRRRIPAGMISVVAGRPGEGKSTFTRRVVADVSQTSAVIYSNQEDPIRETVRPSLEAAGAVLRRVYIPEQPFMLPRDVERLERKVKQIGCKLIVFDSANQHLEPSAYGGQEVRKALTPLKAMLERTGCAAVFVDHLKKRVSATAHPLEALTGAGSGLPAAARFVYVFGTNPKHPEERVLAPVKVNVTKADTSVSFEMQTVEVRLASKGELARNGRLLVEVGSLMVLDDESPCTAQDILSWNGRETTSDLSVTKVAVAAEWLTGFLMFGEKAATEVEDEGAKAGFSWATLRRCAKTVGVVKTRKGFGKQGGWYWRLPDGHLALQMAQQVQQAGLAGNGGTP
jgi:RecA/RadA recombinase